MQEMTWQSLRPQFTSIQEDLDNYSELNPSSELNHTPYSRVQLRLNKAIRKLIHESSFPHFLCVTAPDIYDYYDIIQQLVIENRPSKVFPIICADRFNEIQLFGAIYPSTQEGSPSQKVTGLLHKANGGVLLLSLTHLLLCPPSVWKRLKVTLSRQRIEWESAKPNIYCEVPEGEALHTRIILIGDRGLLSDFDDLEPDLHSLCDYCEFEEEFHLSKNTVKDYLSLIKYMQVQAQVKPLSTEAIKRVMQAGARFTEDNEQMPLCPLWYQALFREAHLFSQNPLIEQEDIQAALTEKHFRASYLPSRGLEDILTGQVFIETSGEQIGQVNGLSVIEIPGHPLTYGEPARISCVVHFGDGEITDVERKVELGGSLHAKGMIIMQAFLQAALELEEPCLYSASIVFEQSYCEVDGDSASLAELCAFVSALSLQPLKQSIAITGAVDQFGRVQAIGGVNEKIEGFYKICAHRGLTGTQGVIFPKANLRALCLNQEIIESVKTGHFHLWPVEDVEEVFPLIAGLPFSPDEHHENEHQAENQEDTSLLEKMSERIESLHHPEPRRISFINSVKNWLNQH